MSSILFPARAVGRRALALSIPLALAFSCMQARAAEPAATHAADAADPRAAVPATRYEPAIRYHADAAPAARPDRNWVAANAAVAGNGAMAGPAQHEHHAGMAMPGDPPATGPAPQQCMPAKDGKGMDCCAGMKGADTMGAGHEHHPGMSMPATDAAGGQCTSCQGRCACCGGTPAAAHEHGAAP
jgi:hypothetical protein